MLHPVPDVEESALERAERIVAEFSSLVTKPEHSLAEYTKLKTYRLLIVKSLASELRLQG